MLHCDLLYLRTRTPQGDGNQGRSRRGYPRILRFKNQNPARGRKLQKQLRIVAFAINLRTRTPPGDGNSVCVLVRRHARAEFKNQNPARGRKRRRVCLQGSVRSFKNQNPARGRKQMLKKAILNERKAFKNQNPARGRKPSLTSARITLYCFSFKNQNPARGRKPVEPTLQRVRLPEI